MQHELLWVSTFHCTIICFSSIVYTVETYTMKHIQAEVEGWSFWVAIISAFGKCALWSYAWWTEMKFHLLWYYEIHWAILDQSFSLCPAWNSAYFASRGNVELIACTDILILWFWSLLQLDGDNSSVQEMELLIQSRRFQIKKLLASWDVLTWHRVALWTGESMFWLMSISWILNFLPSYMEIKKYLKNKECFQFSIIHNYV